MNSHPTLANKIYLAEDDADDRMFFEDALTEVSSQTKLIITEDGVELMSVLDSTVPPVPYALFLDLNMPRKNGFECLKEIRQSDKMKEIPVVVFSTSDRKEIIDRAYSLGANLFISKPPSFGLLKKALQMVLSTDLMNGGRQIPRAQFFCKFA